MCVTHIETPTLFWCQELREPFCTELAKLSHKLTEVCPSAPKVLGHPEPSKVSTSFFPHVKETCKWLCVCIWVCCMWALSRLYVLLLFMFCHFWYLPWPFQSKYQSFPWTAGSGCRAFHMTRTWCLIQLSNVDSLRWIFRFPHDCNLMINSAGWSWQQNVNKH